MRTLWQAGDAAVAEYGQSIESDLRFWKEDVEGSIAHARMLGNCGILGRDEAEQIVSGLEQIFGEGPESLPTDVEDIHTAVEMRLHELIGDVAGKLHTARSRNDQVATDAKLYLRRRLLALSDVVKRLQATLLDIAKDHRRTVLSGKTHFQNAQPITLGFHYLAHFWALQRCGRRLEHVLEFLSTCPLGSAALAGTRFAIDRAATAKELGFASVAPNALDATSDRSWALDVAHALHQLDIELGKMANELVLWSSPEFRLVRLADAYSTGSSIMPQKRNPDIAELIRGRSSTSRGTYVQLASLIAELPLGYHRDYQDDKPALFAALNRSEQMVSLMSGMLATATWNALRMKATVFAGFSNATELADALAQLGLPFRRAHHLTAEIVHKSVERGVPVIDENVLMETLEPEIGQAAAARLFSDIGPLHVASRRQSDGSTGTKPYAAQLRRAKALHRKSGFKQIA